MRWWQSLAVHDFIDALGAPRSGNSAQYLALCLPHMVPNLLNGRVRIARLEKDCNADHLPSVVWYIKCATCRTAYRECTLRSVGESAIASAGTVVLPQSKGFLFRERRGSSREWYSRC